MPVRRSKNQRGVFKNNDTAGRQKLAQAASVMKHMRSTGQKPEKLEKRAINPDSEEGRKIQEDLAKRFPELGIKLPQ